MLSSLIAGLRALFRRDRRNADIASELDGFLDESVQEKMRHGSSREQALRAARAEIGSAESIRHKVWSAGWESTADSLLQDLRFAGISIAGRRSRRALGRTVQIDKNLQVVGDVYDTRKGTVVLPDPK